MRSHAVRPGVKRGFAVRLARDLSGELFVAGDSIEGAHKVIARPLAFV